MSGNIAQSGGQPWPEPNHVDPIQRSWMLPYACTLQALSFTMVSLRLWLRITKRAGTFGLDDAVLIPALVASIAFTTAVLFSTEKFRSGMHIWDVQVALYEPIALLAWVSEFTFLVSSSCTKCSVLLFYRRLTKGSYDRKWKYAIVAAIAITVAHCLAFMLMLILICSPTEAYWRAYSPDWIGRKYTCHDTKIINAISGTMSIISDLYCVILPCMMLRRLQISRSQKIAINFIFSLGLFVVAAGSMRTYYHHQLGNSLDITWTGFDAFVWAELEIQLALICSTAPALRACSRMYLSDITFYMLTPIRACSHSGRDRSTATSDRSFTHIASVETFTMEPLGSTASSREGAATKGATKSSS